MRCVWEADEGLRLPLHRLRLPDASLLRHAQHRDRLPFPSPHSQDPPNNLRRRRRPRLLRLRRVQEAQVREGLPLHRLRLPPPRRLRQVQDQRPPRERHQAAAEAERARRRRPRGLSGGDRVHRRTGGGHRRKRGGRACAEHYEGKRCYAR